MLAPPFPGLKVLGCDAVFGGGHMVDLHTLAHLYIFVSDVSTRETDLRIS